MSRQLYIVVELLIVAFLLLALFFGCSSKAQVVQRNIGVPVVIDTVLRTEVAIPTVEIDAPVLLTTATVIAPAMMEFTHVATTANGSRKTRVRVNNRERTVVVEQEPVVAEMPFVFATVANIPADTVVASAPVGGWVKPVAVGLMLFAAVVLAIVMWLQWRMIQEKDRANSI